ncbi:hydrogenase maturation protease [Candidatus Saganbacteria bacterium]|uniref:Hydrogenase maturation protease n=1 Tax=Candidatus Saganbacteria bacterium TaxID=2575572 RepID=A0A9D6UKK2_UNCSA|nr:hydrogenase maturation protease [Candidatus Saganbacteria bacterium]
MKKNLVLGLGNILMADDGVGVRVIERIGKQKATIVAKLDAEIVNGATGGFALLEVFEKYEKAVVVDAVNMGKMPGTVCKFSAERLLDLPESLPAHAYRQAGGRQGRNFSLHEIGLLEVLKVGKSLNADFKNVVIIGVQPGNLTPGEGLSPEVEAKIPEIIEAVKKEVKYDGNA